MIRIDIYIYIYVWYKAYSFIKAGLLEALGGESPRLGAGATAFCESDPTLRPAELGRTPKRKMFTALFCSEYVGNTNLGPNKCGLFGDPGWLISQA